MLDMRAVFDTCTCVQGLMLGCTVTRRAVDLGCSLDRHDLSAPRHCEFDAERRPEIRAARTHQLAVDKRPKYLCPLCKRRVHRRFEASPSPVFSSCGTWMVTSSLSPGPPELSVDVPFGLRRSVASLRRTSMGVTSALIELTETPSS